MSATYDLSRIGRRVVLATHRRSGTHLGIDLLRRHFLACRARKRWLDGLDTLYLNLDTLDAPWHLPIEVAVERLSRAPRPIVKTHLGPDLEPLGDGERAFAHAVLEDADVIAVHRDVRDVLASFHHYQRGHAASVEGSLSAFIREKPRGQSRPRAWADQVRRWRDAGAHSLAYEEIVARPAAALERMATILRLPVEVTNPILPPPLRGRWHARLLVACARDPEATTVPGAPGRPARWQTALTRDDRAFIHAEAGDLLVELGYETGDHWIDDSLPGE